MTGLVEREPALALLRARLAGTAAAGHVVLVAGEAGIGKTSVLRALAEAHAPLGPVWWGACDALETPHPLAPLLDMARDGARAFASALGGPRPALFEAVLAELAAARRPVLVVVEDVHWADDATLDWLKFLGRRIRRTHALLALSLRDDEVTAAHPLRRVLGELPPDATTRIDLPRLTPQAVAALARDAARPAAGVHALTQGNPFFVTELLRSGAEGAVPRTVQDLVLARYARLPAAAQALVRLVSVLPGRAERWLVDTLLAPALADVEAALASGLLLADAAGYRFRHELGRVAVETSMSPPQAQALHAGVLAALAEPARDTPPARLVHHALQAGDAEAVSRHAPRAAAQASGRGAHREAAAQWRTALRHGAPPDEAERRRWLDAFASACVPCGHLDEGLDALRTLERLARERGDAPALALLLCRQVSMLVGLLRHAEAGASLREALALVDTQRPPAHAHAMVWAHAAWLCMLEREVDDSVAWGTRAAALARTLGDEAAQTRAEGARATALLFIDHGSARALLLEQAASLRAAGQFGAAATALSNLGSGSGELMLLPEAEQCLRDALALAQAHELDGAGRYAKAWLSLVLVWRGRWDEAGTVAAEAVAHADVSGMSRLMALLALGRLRLRRGDPGAEAALDEALALAAPSGTLQRTGPTHAARAEAAWARGDHAAVVAEVAAGLPLARAKRHPWFIGELAYWGWRAGVLAAAPEGCAEPWALQIAGRWRAAAEAWARLDCPYESARALAEGDGAAQREALAAFDRLGALPAADALRRRLSDAGERGIARGARASTRGHPAGLTAAEARVLALMVEGLRNTEIAARLHRSVRTVDHHVAAVLAKLAVDSRAAAVRRAAAEGWAAQSGQAAGEI